MNSEQLTILLKAEIGDYLYIIIFVILMLLGSLEKIFKSKKQQNNPPPTPPPHPYDDFEDVDSEHVPAPQSIEEMMERMLQTMETQEKEQEFLNPYQEYAQKYINNDDVQLYEPIIMESTIKEDEPTNVFPAFEFDIRQAVIASEILNRKYQ